MLFQAKVITHTRRESNTQSRSQTGAPLPTAPHACVQEQCQGAAVHLPAAMQPWQKTGGRYSVSRRRPRSSNG